MKRILTFVLICVATASLSTSVAAQTFRGACARLVLPSPPTDKVNTFIRAGFGEFGAPRKGGESTHKGIDITRNMTSADPEATAVFAVSDGVVAYSRVNGSDTTGYGNVVVIDHGNGCYVMYAHLATKPFTPAKPGENLSVQVGTRVVRGQIIAYFVDIKSDTTSTGNAVRTDPAAREQVHFQLIEAPSGRKDTGNGSLSALLGNEGVIVDPTAMLKQMGYLKR